MKIISNWPVTLNVYENQIRIVVIIVLIFLLTIVFLFIERFIQDRSDYKYTEVFSLLNRKIAAVARDIDLKEESNSHWRKTTERALKQLHDSFLSVKSQQLRGEKYAVIIYIQDGDKLKRSPHSYMDDDLFEVAEQAIEFESGTGYVGTAWHTGQPQTGGKRKRLRKDPRYLDSSDPNARALSFFCTKICRNMFPDKAVVLCIASDSARDFLWHPKHAENLHYGLQPFISLIEFCLERSET